MIPAGDLQVVSATRDAHGSYIESLLTKLAHAELEAARFKSAWEEAEAENERMARQLQRAFDQGYNLTENTAAAPAETTSQLSAEATPPQSSPGLAS